MIDKIIDAILSNPWVTITCILCVTFTIYVLRSSPFVIALLQMRYGKKFSETLSDMKCQKQKSGSTTADEQKSGSTTADENGVKKILYGGLEVSGQVHSYRIRRCWGQDKEKVYEQVNEMISVSRKNRWECAIDFSDVISSMNRQSHDGILKSVRLAKEQNSVGLVIVFPNHVNLADNKDKILLALFEKLSEECADSVTIEIKLDTRAAIRYKANVNVNYFTPIDVKHKDGEKP